MDSLESLAADWDKRSEASTKEGWYTEGDVYKTCAAELRTTLAELRRGEAVAWMLRHQNGAVGFSSTPPTQKTRKSCEVMPLYAAPPTATADARGLAWICEQYAKKCRFVTPEEAVQELEHELNVRPLPPPPKEG